MARKVLDCIEYIELSRGTTNRKAILLYMAVPSEIGGSVPK